MKVTHIDYCMQGFERLRSQNEIIVCAWPLPGDTGAELVKELQSDLRLSNQLGETELDEKAAEAAIETAFKERGWMELKNPFDAPPYKEDEDRPTLFCYIQITD